MAAFWRKSQWFVLIALIPAWLYYVVEDRANALSMASLLGRLLVFNLLISIPVALVLWVPLPKDSPHLVLRGMLLILLCGFHSIIAAAIAQFYIKHAQGYTWHYGALGLMWWIPVFLVSFTPLSFRYRYKAVKLPETLIVSLYALSIFGLFLGAESPRILGPFVELPVVKTVLGWVFG